MMLEPDSIDSLLELVRAGTKMLAVGSETKEALCLPSSPFERLSMKRLSGIIDYEPSEYTFTAWAGTSVHEVAEALREKGQYLPFSPMLVAAGATLGGTVASGISGAGRFRFGGVRDFLLGLRLIDGAGRLISGGGKVVKNAAGFDIPKLMVGSLGRLGIITEVTFKVFPKPSGQATLSVACASHAQAMERLMFAASKHWEIDAMDYDPQQQRLALRVAEALAMTVANTWGDDSQVIEGAPLWGSHREFHWVPDSHIIIKIPVTPKRVASLLDRLSGLDSRSRISVGGNLLWLAVPPARLTDVDTCLTDFKLAGLAIRGKVPTIQLGYWPQRAIDTAIKRVFDPVQTFPPF